MGHTIEEIGAKMDALDLWPKVLNCHFAFKPKGCVFPFFFAAVPGEIKAVKMRLFLLDGWQTFHDFLRTRIDPSFGFYSTPMEMPHFELLILADRSVKLFRHDPCYMPTEATPAQRELCARIFWEVYGVMMRIESDPKTPMMYAEEQAIFSRVEGRGGKWTDAPLPIIQPRPHVEQISFAKDDLKRAKDRPFAADEAMSVEFRIQIGLMTREPRPRVCYTLVAVDAKTGTREIFDQISPNAEGGLRGMWEGMPQRFLQRLVERGRIPGEIRVCSKRMYRMLRPLLLELPFKLSMNEHLPEIEAQFALNAGGR